MASNIPRWFVNMIGYFDLPFLIFYLTGPDQKVKVFEGTG